MDLIQDYKASFERHFKKPAPKVWAKPSGGFTIVHSDGHRERVTKTDLKLITSLNNDLAAAVEEINHG